MLFLLARALVVGVLVMGPRALSRARFILVRQPALRLYMSDLTVNFSPLDANICFFLVCTLVHTSEKGGVAIGKKI